MAIKKLPSGLFQCDWRGPDKRRERQSFETMREAKAFLASVQHRVIRGDYVDPKSLPTVKDAAESWLKLIVPTVRPASLQNYTGFVSLFINPKLGAFRIDQVTVDVVERFITEIRTEKSPKSRKPLSGSSARNVTIALSQILSGYFRQGLLRNDPTKLIRKGMFRETEAQERDEPSGPVDESQVLSADEIRRLVDAAEPGVYRTLILTLAMTGMRSGEAFALRWQDCDLATGSIHVGRSFSWSYKASGAKPTPRFDVPKTKAGIRDIKIAPSLVAELRKWKLACPPNPYNLVFPHPRTGEPLLRVAAFERGLAPALKKAGLRHVGFHALRHSHASIWLASGAPIVEVSKRLGHASAKITLGTYAHYIPSQDSGTTEKLDRAFLGSGHSMDTQTANNR